MIDAPKLEGLAAAQEASSDYRVLRRLRPRRPVEGYDAAETSLGLMVDVETTGLDPDLNKIIEPTIVPFRRGLDGMSGGPRALRPSPRPTKPISPEITTLTGISDAMVDGKGSR
ncbi:exonuclease domain-containing protein [Agrobacterium sp. P15N1-A]|uniref:exonuclease domain-containing protein n=1 Tax=unclassified Agrobacterium TaxID=2632611 RepID=UPI0037D47583